MLITFFVCEMKRRLAELNRVWFRQDGAANQTAFACMNFPSLFLGVPEVEFTATHPQTAQKQKANNGDE
jgi:hypothetical protein